MRTIFFSPGLVLADSLTRTRRCVVDPLPDGMLTSGPGQNLWCNENRPLQLHNYTQTPTHADDIFRYMTTSPQVRFVQGVMGEGVHVTSRVRHALALCLSGAIATEDAVMMISQLLRHRPDLIAILEACTDDP